MTVSDEAKKALEGVTPGPWKSVFDRLTWGWLEIDGLSFKIGTPTRATDLSLADEIQRKTDARFIAWAREGVPALLAEIAAKDAEIARLRGEIIEATDENFIWGAMDNVHDADTTLEDYAAAVSRAQRAALARVKGGE